jgi:hypothetical protein
MHACASASHAQAAAPGVGAGGPPMCGTRTVHEARTPLRVEPAFQHLGDFVAGVVDPAMVYRSRQDIRILTVDERLDLADVLPGWSPLVGEFFA